MSSHGAPPISRPRARFAQVPKRNCASKSFKMWNTCRTVSERTRFEKSGGNNWKSRRHRDCPD